MIGIGPNEKFAHRHADLKKDRQTDKQTHRQIDKQAHRQTE